MHYVDYSGFAEYDQLHGEFIHQVSVLDAYSSMPVQMFRIYWVWGPSDERLPLLSARHNPDQRVHLSGDGE